MTLQEQAARAYARDHGFKLRVIPYSTDHPNGYISVKHPASGRRFRVTSWAAAFSGMMAVKGGDRSLS